MSFSERRYNNNCITSIELCLNLESLVNQAKYFEGIEDWDNRELILIEYNVLKLQLDEIWSEQVDLYFQIQDEYVAEAKRRAKRIGPNSKPDFTATLPEEEALIINVYKTDKIFNLHKLAKITKTDYQVVNRIITKYLVEKFN